MVAAITEPRVRCSRLHALSAVKAPKFLLNPAETGQYTATIVSEKSDPIDK